MAAVTSENTKNLYEGNLLYNLPLGSNDITVYYLKKIIGEHHTSFEEDGEILMDKDTNFELLKVTPAYFPNRPKIVVIQTTKNYFEIINGEWYTANGTEPEYDIF